VTLNRYTLALESGDDETLTAEVLPDEATDKAVSWSSSAPTVADVDDNGKVTALKEGEARITATAAGIESTACVVTVTTPPVVEPEEKWARSNIVWIPDSSRPDGGYLTFAVTAEDNRTKIPANVQGLIFKWGSLVALNMSGQSAFTRASFIYDPRNKPTAYYDAIPFGSTAASASPAEDNLKTIGTNGVDETAAKGDICRLISAKGWVTGSWRMPTHQEVLDLYTESPDAIGVQYGTWTSVGLFTPAGNSEFGDYAHGFYPLQGGRMLSTGATAGDDITNPSAGVFMPASSRRSNTGVTTAVGTSIYMWTSTAGTVANNGTHYYINANRTSVGNTNGEYANTIRCVRD
jgi:hypothetical protein